MLAHSYHLYFLRWKDLLRGEAILAVWLRSGTDYKVWENTGAGRTFFERVLEGKNADSVQAANCRPALTEPEIAVDATGFQLVGADTIAITLTLIVWGVLNRPELQKQLEQEVAGLSEDFTDATCEQLPLLEAVINETLRLHGAAPMSLRRVVPFRGATLGGHYIPGTTVIATQAYSLHRNADQWKDPEM